MSRTQYFTQVSENEFNLDVEGQKGFFYSYTVRGERRGSHGSGDGMWEAPWSDIDSEDYEILDCYLEYWDDETNEHGPSFKVEGKMLEAIKDLLLEQVDEEKMNWEDI